MTRKQKLTPNTENKSQVKPNNDEEISNDSLEGKLQVDTSDEGDTEAHHGMSTHEADSSSEPNQTGPSSGPTTNATVTSNEDHTGSNEDEDDDDDFDDDNNELIDKSVENKIRSIAAKNNLDHNEVRQILRKLVKNDHVLALVKIKEEQLMKLENKNKPGQSATSTPTKNITITRLRAKELNPNPTPMKQQQITSETALLIQQELHPDEEDDEYQPCEEDLHSDDNTTISDIDSQPRTPATPFQMGHDNSGYMSPASTKAGVFKVPKSVHDVESQKTTTEEQEIIALRTRSKVCLQATPIEEIESTLIPPDITLDMYDFDWEIDNVYKEFLTDMQKPMNHHVENDDDENDPEYVAADKEPIDREELKMSRVSKKEVNDLLKEVWDYIGTIDFDESLLENVTNELVNTNQNNILDKSRDLQTPDISRGKPSPRPKKINSQPTSLNNTEIIQMPEDGPVVLTYTQLENVKCSPKSQNTFNPNVMSTPAREQFILMSTEPNLLNTPIITQLESGADQTPSTSSNIIQPSLTIPLMQSPFKVPDIETCSIQAQSVNNMNIMQSAFVTPMAGNTISSAVYLQPAPSTTYFIQDNQNNLYQLGGVSYQNGILQIPSVQFPTIPTTEVKEGATETLLLSQSFLEQINDSSNCSSQASTPNLPMVTLPAAANLTDDVKTQSRSFTAMEKRYAYLRDGNYEMKFDMDQIGFTDFQRQLLDQQLRQHVQFLMTNFAQSYGHPVLFKYADQFSTMLKEIDAHYETNKLQADSAWNIWNLKPTMKFCDSWVKSLSIDCKNNRKYLDFLNKEVARAKETFHKNKQNKPIRLAKKLTKWLIKSDAVVYPKLLPRSAFSIIPDSSLFKSIFLPSEDYFYAYRLEKCYEQIKHSLETGKMKKQPTLRAVACLIASELNCRYRKGNSIFTHITSKKSKVSPMNPIKYYFEHSKRPPMKYRLDPFDPNSVKPLCEMTREEISNDVWEKLVFTKSRIGKLHNKKLLENGLPPEYVVASSSEDSDVELVQENNTNLTPEPNRRIEIKYKNAGAKELQPNTINLHIEERIRNPIAPQSNSTVSSRINCSCSSVDDYQSVCDASDTNETSSFERNQRLLTEFFPKRTKQRRAQRQTTSIDYEIQSTFHGIIEKFHGDYDKYKLNISQNELLLNVYNSIKTLDIYTQLLVDIKMNPNFQINLDNISNSSEQLVQSGSSSPAAINSTGTQKNIHQINSKFLSDEREFNYAQNFYDKVRETFLTENNSKDFEAFQNYLVNFDCEKDTVPELYYKMEKLFYPRHQELAELFLTFLLPGHAAQVGKFYEHFMLTNMATFISKLNAYYSRQPSQIRKIYLCLTDLAKESDLSMDRIRQKILPLLKGNQILTDWFLQLFPSERPLETREADYETIHVPKHTNDESKDDTSDGYERIPPSEIVQDNENQGCGIKYIQGRIYYGNRVLLPAKLSFLAYDILPLKMSTSSSSKSMHDNQSIKSITDSDIEKIVECVHGFGGCFSERSIRSEDIIKISDDEVNSWQSDCLEGASDSLNQSKEKQSKTAKRKYSGLALSPPLNGKESSSAEQYVLCDKETLKQHAIRLNPILHGNKVQEPDNVENNGTTTKDDSSDSSVKNSPKRQKLNLLSPPRLSSPLASSSNSSHVSSSNVSKIPVQKKPSPNNNHKVSNKKSPSDENNKSTMGTMPKPSSPAIKTAQNIKKLMCAGDSSSDDDRPLIERLEHYRLKKLADTNIKLSQQTETICNEIPLEEVHPPLQKTRNRRKKKITVESDLLAEPLPPPPPQHEKKMDDEKNMPSTSSSYKSIAETTSIVAKESQQLLSENEVKVEKGWTRNEDKVILEAIDCGLTSEQELYEEISTVLTDRTYEEIVKRHKFLMDVLKQFQSNT